MRNLFIALSVVAAVLQFSTRANDCSITSTGPGIVPLQETSISVTKEVLTFGPCQGSASDGFYWISAEVYYEFYNPGPAKTITVAFISKEPSSEIDFRKKTNPAMKNFAVRMNGQLLKYKSDIVYERSLKPVRSEKAFFKETFENHATYAYYFKAHFKHGKNTIHHTYKYMGCYGVLNYALTPAIKWANKQIDDFTLIIKPGLNNYKFGIIARDDNYNTRSVTRLFDNAFRIIGNGTWRYKTIFSDYDKRSYRYAWFYMKDKTSKVVWHKKNFKSKANIAIDFSGMCLLHNL